MIRSFRALLDAGPVAGLSDGQLLERFTTRDRDAAEAAFAAVVARHGPMVRRICRGVLANPHDADDAFQATFLVLARKARSIRQPDRLANWLYGTAHRASKKLKADAARRRKHEAARQPPDVAEATSIAEEIGAVLDEVARLPHACRVAVILCDLEGLTQDEAADRLGCSDRTLRRRLTRAHDLLRDRLTRQGLAPASALFALKSSPVPALLVDSTARAALRFAAGQSVSGIVPASALLLAEGVIKVMTWTKLKAMGIGLLLVLGGGIGVASAFAILPQDSPARPKSKPKAETQKVAPKISPADRYKALVKRYDDALKVYQDAASKAKTPEEISEIYMKVGPVPDEHLPGFVALAEEFPADPVAVNALMWVANQALSSAYQPDKPSGRAYARVLEILARDHADEPLVGDYCRRLSMNPVSAKENFLRAIAGRTKDRATRGRATLALAEYLRIEADMADLYQHPDRPINFDPWIPADTPPDTRRKIAADLAEARRQGEDFQTKYQPDHVKALKHADVSALRRESVQAFDRVLAEFADVPSTLPSSGAPSRETLADLVRKHQNEQPNSDFFADLVKKHLPPGSSGSRFKPLAEAFKAAQKKADEAATTAGQDKPDMKAYVAAAPKWADFGPKIWAIAEAAPRSPDGFDALLWIARNHMPFFDTGEERVVVLGKAVDLLIRDHLDYIGDHLDDRRVAEGFNGWYPVPAPHIDRVFRALFERGKTREIRGRMGLMLARHLKGEADFVESLDVRGADPGQRLEITIFAPSYLEGLRKTGHRGLADEATTILEKIKADYGDVADRNGVGPTGETLAAVVDRELADLRTLAVGEVAPEIVGKDVAGQPMKLSEFRGKVIVLDFGTHEHCGGCKLVYPRLRELVDQHKARPLAVLGINFGDRLETLKELAAKQDVTWRCWWDGDDAVHPGPITTRWNIRGYPTFIVLDHRGVIRFKDLHPFDPTFGPAIEALVKEAEAAGR